MKAFIFVVWGLMLIALIAVIAAGHTGPAALTALAGGLACLAGVFFVLYRGWHRIGIDRNDKIEGKPVIWIFVLIGASILLIILSALLE